jgi:hypothetical protein
MEAVAADPTWDAKRHRKFNREQLNPDKQVALILQAKSTEHARALSAFVKASTAIREAAVITLESRDLDDK